MTKPDLNALTTEASNPRTEELDAMSTLDLVTAMNDEDHGVANAVRSQLPRIAELVDAIAERLRKGGRLIYCGAGSSGRLGVLDAAECAPTFSASPDQVLGLIAGGPAAILRSVEGAEDSEAGGAADLRAIHVGNKDVVVGIAASGRTPYVLGALAHAKSVGAHTAAVVCNHGSPAAALANVAIELLTGPEVITGSTRLKAGTATKMVLNMLTTGAMVLLGKTYGNLMVDMNASNSKLLERAKRIVCTLTELAPEQAASLLATCDGEVKTAITSYRLGVTPEEARVILHATNGHLRAALESMGRLNGHATNNGRTESNGHAANGSH